MCCYFWKALTQWQRCASRRGAISALELASQISIIRVSWVSSTTLCSGDPWTPCPSPDPPLWEHPNWWLSFHSRGHILPGMPQDKMSCRCLRGQLATLRNQVDLVTELATSGVSDEGRMPITNSRGSRSWEGLHLTRPEGITVNKRWLDSTVNATQRCLWESLCDWKQAGFFLIFFFCSQRMQWLYGCSQETSFHEQTQGQAAAYKLLRCLCCGSLSFSASEEPVLYVCEGSQQSRFQILFTQS